MCCVIMYHLYNSKNVKNTHGELLKLVTLLKVTLLHECFSRFLNQKNGTKIARRITFMYQTIYKYLQDP